VPNSFASASGVRQDAGVRRIAVIGCIGAGKSTVARALGTCLGIEVTHLDRLWWQAGHYRITGSGTVASRTMDAESFRRLQHDLAAGHDWIIDGGYIGDLDTRLARADTVVFLDLPRRVCLWRLLKRHNRRRPDYPDGVREGIGWLWLLARWVWSYPKQKRPQIEQAIIEHAHDAAIIRLRTNREVRRFLRRVPTA
jgi:adenylate kinase family enzyme